MFDPSEFSLRLAAAAGAMIITVVMMATAIIPATPGAGAILSGPFAMGALA